MKRDNLFFLIIVFSCLIFLYRLKRILLGDFSFTWDFARDLLWIRQLTIQHKPILVGPWGSLDNTFFGPFYYYLIAIPIFIFNGNPKAAVVLINLLISLIIPLSYFLGKSVFDKKMGGVFALFFGLLPAFNKISLYAFSQNLIPFLYFLFFILQWQLLRKPSYGKIMLICFLSSLFFHFEPVNFPLCFFIAIGIILYLLLKIRLRKPFLVIVISLITLIIPFIPNIIFDLRHNFGQLYGFERFFTGKDISLHGVLPLKIRFYDRLKQFSYMFSYTFFFSSSNIAKLLFFLPFIVIWKKRRKILIYFQNQKKALFIKLIMGNLIITYIYYLIFPSLLKNYYLYMLPVLYVLFIGIVLSVLINTNKFLINSFIVFIFIFLLFNFSKNLQNYNNLIIVKGQTYFAQKYAIDKIYKLANNRPFFVYTYSTGIYDYPYQYLFSWYGYKTYGYIPIEYSYLPNQPEYVLNKKYFDEKKVTNRTSFKPVDIFLILEEGDQIGYNKDHWLSNFPIKNKISSQEFFDGIRLIHLQISGKQG